MRSALFFKSNLLIMNFKYDKIAYNIIQLIKGAIKWKLKVFLNN